MLSLGCSHTWGIIGACKEQGAGREFAQCKRRVCHNPIGGEQKSPVLAGARHGKPGGLMEFSSSFTTGLGWEEGLLSAQSTGFKCSEEHELCGTQLSSQGQGATSSVWMSWYGGVPRQAKPAWESGTNP